MSKFKKITGFIRKHSLSLIQFLCLVGFLALAEDVFNRELMRGDVIGYELISGYLISDLFTPAARVITNLGGVYWILGLTVFLMIFLKKKEQKIRVAVNLVLVTGMNQLLKQLVQRPRPEGFRIIEESGYSFPSGHSMVSMAFYGYLIYLIYKSSVQPYLKWTGIIGLGILIPAIGISRIYLGVHYTSDVLAGFLISAAYLILFVRVTDGGLHKKEKK